MKLVERYTIENYASALEIKNDFHIGSQIIQQEIENYREKYRIYFTYQNNKYSLVYLPKIKKILNEYYNFEHLNELHPYIQVFILRNDIESCKRCILKYQLPNELLMTFGFISSFEEELTKSFIEWLEHLTTFKFIKMLKYEYKIQQLTKKQISFYIEHDSYFDICEYQSKCQISYETARLQLVYLNKMGLITRHKIGKKYYFKRVYD